MLLTLGNRLSTQDIDVFPLNYADSSHPDQRTQKILTAIRAVASRNVFCSERVYASKYEATPMSQSA